MSRESNEPDPLSVWGTEAPTERMRGRLLAEIHREQQASRASGRAVFSQNRALLALAAAILLSVVGLVWWSSVQREPVLSLPSQGTSFERLSEITSLMQKQELTSGDQQRLLQLVASDSSVNVRLLGLEALVRRGIDPGALVALEAEQPGIVVAYLRHHLLKSAIGS